MRYAKIFGLLAIAAAALMAFAGVASATTGTDSAGGSPVEVNDVIHSELVGEAVLDGTINVKCKKSTVNGKVTNAGSATETLKGEIFPKSEAEPNGGLTFEECGANTVSVAKPGTLEIHTHWKVVIDKPGTKEEQKTEPECCEAVSGRGTLTSSGAEVTILTHNILGTVHCIYVTNETDVGTLDGSKNTGGKATLTVDSVPIPRAATDFGCGSTSEWTAEYTVITPAYLDID
jgi:uncharacterized protein with beta-barrel porin domain